ncbi:MAG TPA: hypothetical protein VKV27_04035 [Solirubrobacteraceae bacterium]|nr:hypothetical protein [Solirubrobacteraceae bacterium]
MEAEELAAAWVAAAAFELELALELDELEPHAAIAALTISDPPNARSRRMARKRMC